MKTFDASGSFKLGEDPLATITNVAGILNSEKAGSQDAWQTIA